MTVRPRNSRLPAVGFLAMALSVAQHGGCTRGPDASDAPAAGTVVAVGGTERVLLVSEARAAAGEFDRSTFVVSSTVHRPVTLQLSAVGCNCFRVRHGDRILHVGDDFAVAAGRTEEIEIESQFRTSPGVTQHRADFIGTDGGGTVLSVPLTSTVRTVADLAVRPDVIHHPAGATASGRNPGFELLIEQHARSGESAGLRVDWIAVPRWLECTRPTLAEPVVEVHSGLWRARWRSTIRVAGAPDPASESPVQLQLESFHADRRLAQAACTLIVRPGPGVRAPAMVHFGRPGDGVSEKRRIQLTATDDRPFAVTSAGSRDGTVAATVLRPGRSPEHWLELQLVSAGRAVDDVLRVRTDHPAGAEVAIRVRALAPPGH